MPNRFYGFMVKLPFQLALHLIVAPSASQGMLIMKYSVNNQDEFVKNGAITAYLAGLAQYLIAVYCHVVNTIVMLYASTVQEQ